MPKKLIIANWKDHPETLAAAQELVVRIDENLRELGRAELYDLIVCPPAQYREVAARLGVLGSQDMDDGTEGVRYVIVGHSDRRRTESDDVTNEKLKAALAAGLIPIICLGERSREGAWQDELSAQTSATFRGMTPGQVSQCLIAYEPVWAISTNPGATPDTPPSAVQAMGVIRDTLVDRFDVSHPTFLYGGSVTPDNAADFLSRSEISGVLVGRASLNADDFVQIIKSALSGEGTVLRS